MCEAEAVRHILLGARAILAIIAIRHGQVLGIDVACGALAELLANLRIWSTLAGWEILCEEGEIFRLVLNEWAGVSCARHTTVEEV